MVVEGDGQVIDNVIFVWNESEKREFDKVLDALACHDADFHRGLELRELQQIVDEMLEMAQDVCALVNDKVIDDFEAE